jgi:23S rRNA (cytosine1962-C5)-methyltransferase
MAEPDLQVCDAVLKPGRDRSVRRRHPWLLANAIDRMDGPPASGGWIRICSADGEPLAHGHYSPESRLRVRLVAFGKEAPPEDWLEARIAEAVARRERDPALASTDAIRLVNSEGDWLPGLVVDRYADTAVVRITAPGMEARRDAIAAALARSSGAARGFERADATAARREGFAVRTGPLWGDAPPSTLEIREGERRYLVDVGAGQKTGFYLDQRDARDRIQSLAGGGHMLDLFSYTGGFAVAAQCGGAARVTLVDSSQAALDLAAQNLALNGDAPGAELLKADGFQFLRQTNAKFDCIVIDPPPLARNRRDVEKATRAYKDLMLHGLKRLTPGGVLAAFSCSHHVSPDLFRKIAFGASLDAGRSAQVLGTFTAPVDHPASIDHLEGSYLSGLLLRV